MLLHPGSRRTSHAPRRQPPSTKSAEKSTPHCTAGSARSQPRCPTRWVLILRGKLLSRGCNQVARGGTTRSIRGVHHAQGARGCRVRRQPRALIPPGANRVPACDQGVLSNLGQALPLAADAPVLGRRREECHARGPHGYAAVRRCALRRRIVRVGLALSPRPSTLSSSLSGISSPAHPCSSLLKTVANSSQPQPVSPAHLSSATLAPDRRLFAQLSSATAGTLRQSVVD